MATRLIIGLGTGRCGTVSLKALLSLQPNTNATHETMLLPHKFSEVKYKQYMARLWKRPEEISADVALWTLSYVTAIIAEYPTTKFICLKRDKEPVVKSFIAKTARNRNHWTRYDSKHWNEEEWFREHTCPYRNCYPRFDANKEEALGFYWDYYYTIAETYEKAFPDNFRIFPIEELNSQDGCARILDFAGYSEMNIQVGIHRNRVLTTLPKKNRK